MGVGGSIVVLVVAWWIAFQAILPMGVKSPAEMQLGRGEIIGDHGAPVKPQILKKGLLSAAAAIVIWAALYALVEWSGLTFEDLPSP